METCLSTLCPASHAEKAETGRPCGRERRKSTEESPPCCRPVERGRQAERKEPKTALVSDIPGLVPLRLSSCLWMTRTPIQSSKHSHLLCDDGNNATPLQHAGDRAKEITWINSFKPHSNHPRQVLLSPLYRWENWGFCGHRSSQ